ncbi:MAG: hypothetical protein LIP05_09645 [Tannerellaceae bacterium]|nr:hypothetical protein [Tannerellaceae bacterium]
MDKHHIDPQQIEKGQQDQADAKQTSIDPEKIDWVSIEKNTGITKRTWVRIMKRC